MAAVNDTDARRVTALMVTRRACLLRHLEPLASGTSSLTLRGRPASNPMCEQWCLAVGGHLLIRAADTTCGDVVLVSSPGFYFAK